MQQENALEQFIQRFNDENKEGSQDEPEETYHIYPVSGGMVILKEEPEDQIIDATPSQNTQKSSILFIAATVIFCLIIPISSILFQVYLLLNPPIATVTIIPNVQTFTLKSTLQMGRMLPPITLSQLATVPTTGRGHQDATKAAGTLTFYNGQVQTITIPAGTILTSANGTQTATDQDANIPAESHTIPPTLGQVTVSAHALIPGAKGNIQTGAINQSCCFTSILVQNTTAFYGGQDARDFQTVAKADISNAITPMKTTLAQSIIGALQGQLKSGEELGMLPCSPVVTADHQIGEEATTVKVTVSETCNAAAYKSNELYAKAQALFSHSATLEIGSGYSLFGETHVTSIKATVTQHTPTVFLSFVAQGTYVYALKSAEQERITKMIAGKTIQEALQLLTSFKGIKSVSLQWDTNTKLPQDPQQIKLLVIVNL